MDHTRHASRVKVTATGVLAPLWHSEAARKRWVIDPTEWDRGYKHGIGCVEASLRLDPSLWDLDWIREHTTRCAHPRGFFPPQAGDADRNLPTVDHVFSAVLALRVRVVVYSPARTLQSALAHGKRKLESAHEC